jgi:hypothetical protein
MTAVTNRGKYLLLNWGIRGATRPVAFYAALIADGSVPALTTNTFVELTEIAAGNGYTAGGISLAPGAVDFDVLTEDDVLHKAFVQIKDLVWTAAGGNLPASGNGARYLILTTDEVTQGDRQVVAYWDLGSAITVSDTQSLTVQNSEVSIEQPV